MTSVKRPVRIGNASGFYGDRPRLLADLVATGDVDVVTGDYLAELTMLILWKARKRDPEAGYARTFLGQFAQVANDVADRGIKIVVNAGGLAPAVLADKVRAAAAEAGVRLSIAHIEGDDLSGRIAELGESGIDLANLDTGVSLAESGATPVTANAYLGGWGIAAALRAGADVVITPRVTDAALVVGVGAWWHDWSPTDFDALAGAVAAGHIIECGPQATGGNYSQIHEIADRRYPGSPIAELAHDGGFVITKTSNTGGLVSVGTVTAQLLYEVDSPAYLNPDVVAHFDSLILTQDGPDRVRVTGAVGSPPPSTLKVAMNYIGGYRNTMTLVLTGLDIEEKARWATDSLFALLGGRERFDAVDVDLVRYDRPDPFWMADAAAHLRFTVKSTDRARVDRAFSGAVTELALANVAGFHTTTPPSSASEFGVYWPTIVPAELVDHTVVHPDGRRESIPHSAIADDTVVDARFDRDTPTTEATAVPGPTTRRPLGDVMAARSGDKGGNANIGVWTDTDTRWEWLRDTLTVERFRAQVADAAGFEIRRYAYPNLKALNFVVVGWLGEGVASCTRTDAQAKSFGEFLRATTFDIPDALFESENR